MTDKIKNQYLIAMITIAVFSYLGTLVQTWDYTERLNLNTPLIITWLSGAMIVLGLLFTQQQQNTHIPKSILWWAVSIIISILALPIMDYPMASLMGVPLNNMGIAQHMAGIAIAYAVYKICHNNPNHKNILITITAISLLVFTITTVATTEPNGRNRYAMWLDVHALMALPSLIIFAIGLYQPTKWVKYIAIAGIVLAIYNIAISKNQTAQILLILLPVVVGALYAIDKIFTKNTTFIKAILNPLSVLITTGFVMSMFVLAPQMEGMESGTKLSILSTLTQRSLVLNTYFVSIYYDITSLFTGFGWGSMRDIQMNYGGLASAIFESEHRIYPLEDRRAIINSGIGATSLHNIFIDLMAGIGIFGGIAFLLMLYHLGRACAGHHMVLGAWIILGAFYSFWFSTSVTVVPFLIAIGMTAAIIPTEQDESCPHAQKIATAPVQKIIFALSAIVLCFSAFYKIKQINLLSKTIVEGKIAPELFYENFYNQDSTNFQDSVIFFRSQINIGLLPLVKSEPMSEQQLLIMVDAIDVLKEKSDNGHKKMTAELLNIINIIMKNGENENENMQKARQRYFPLWQSTLKQTVQQTPYRSFLWRPYLKIMYDSEQYQMVGNMAQYILQNGNPNDPMALYYRGLAFRALGDEQSAKNDIQLALDYGITAFLPNARNSLKQ